MLFENNDFDLNLKLFMPDISFDRGPALASTMEGFLRGNMFLDEYEPYRNLTYLDLKPTNEQEKDLYKIMAYAFAITDLNLYLDLHPDNKEVFDTFKKYIKEKDELCKNYIRKYGPLEINETIFGKYNWLDSPWPWDSEGGTKYV